MIAPIASLLAFILSPYFLRRLLTWSMTSFASIAGVVTLFTPAMTFSRFPTVRSALVVTRFICWVTRTNNMARIIPTSKKIARNIDNIITKISIAVIRQMVAETMFCYHLDLSIRDD
jgi:hypothetical protein